MESKLAKFVFFLRLFTSVETYGVLTFDQQRPHKWYFFFTYNKSIEYI